jgi:hypothetical protein
MKKISFSFYAILLAFLLLPGVIVDQAQSASLVFNLDTTFSGETPKGAAPWIRVQFDDIGPNEVRLTINADNLVDFEAVTRLYLNFDDSLDVTFLTIDPVDTSASNPQKINKVKDKLKADGDGFFDILFIFPKGQFDNRFTKNETVIFDMTYTGVGFMDAGSFGYLSSPGGGAGPYYSAAHIQGISSSICPSKDSACESGWIGYAGVIIP